MANFNQIANAVAALTDVKVEVLKSETKTRSVAYARLLFVNTCKSNSVKSYDEIGAYMGKTQQCVNRIVRKTENLMYDPNANRQFNQDINKITLMLK